MVGRKVRMVEIVRRIVRHAELFHDAARAQVAYGREGDDLLEADVLESHTKGGTRRPRWHSHAPMGERQTPPDLHAGAARDGERGVRESRVADEPRAPA